MNKLGARSTTSRRKDHTSQRSDGEGTSGNAADQAVSDSLENLQKLESKLCEISAILALCAENETRIDLHQLPLSGQDNLLLLVEKIKMGVQSVEHDAEQSKGETRCLRDEEAEEAATRSKTAVELENKTRRALAPL